MKGAHGQHVVLGTVALGLVDLFLLILNVLLPMVQPVHHNDGIELPVEYIAWITWPGKCDCDVDLFAAVPGKKDPIFWSNRQVGNAFLDQDSRGYADDKLTQPDGTVIWNIHREQITIKGIQPGVYTFAVHMFRYTMDNPLNPPGTTVDHLNTPVHMEVWKMRPAPKPIFISGDSPQHPPIVLQKVGDGFNIASIKIDNYGYQFIDPPLTPLPENVYTTKGESTTRKTFRDE